MRGKQADGEGETRAGAGKRASVEALGAELNALMVASRAVVSDAAESFQPPISAASFQVLQWLQAFGPANASAIADALAMDRSVVSRLTRQLNVLGLTTSWPDDRDGRGVVTGLTETAHAKVVEVTARKGSLFETRLENWSQADIDLLANLLRRLNGRG